MRFAPSGFFLFWVKFWVKLATSQKLRRHKQRSLAFHKRYDIFMRYFK